MSAKRENDDLLVNGYEEVYNARTGEYLSGEVEETVKVVDYDTHWVNLYDVTGITTIKAVPNGDVDPSNNNHDIYVNGITSTFVPEYNKVAFVKTSRHFDIEMKDVYYVKATTTAGKTEYEVVESKIPMLFVQEENIEDFGAEAKSNNEAAFSINPGLPTGNIAIAKANYQSLRTLLDTLKEKLTFDELVAALGTENPFFVA